MAREQQAYRSFKGTSLGAIVIVFCVTLLSVTEVLQQFTSPLHQGCKLHFETNKSTELVKTSLNEHVHVLYGLSGNAAGFLEEFKVSLKSVLLNSPFHFDLTIHIMADDTAFDALQDVFSSTGISNWTTLNPTRIQTYNVESHIPEWRAFIEEKMRFGAETVTRVHTIGTFFRLFAHKVVDIRNVGHFVYLDTDVAIMASLDGLWQNVNPNVLFQWGPTMTAGFIVINAQEMDTLWETVAGLDLHNLSKALHQAPNDQLVFQSINAR